MALQNIDSSRLNLTKIYTNILRKDCYGHKELKLTGQYLFPYPFSPTFREYSPRLPTNFVINFSCHFFLRVYMGKCAHS